LIGDFRIKKIEETIEDNYVDYVFTLEEYEPSVNIININENIKKGGN
jgi:hypothetical protein